MRRSVKHKIYLESDGFLNSLSKWMILSTVMTVAMAACGGKGTRGSGSSAAPAIPPVNHNASGGEQPSGAPPSSPPTKPPPTLDLNVTELSPNGCLDLQRLAEQSGQFPSSSYVREYTRSVLVTSAPPPGAALARFRNMEAEVAFANFSLRLQPSGNFAAGMPAITQTGCTEVNFTDAMGEKEKFEIVKSDQANEVHLKSGDGLREKTYVIRSPRSLELRLSGSYIDRCPGFTKAQITVVRERTWGNASDLKSDPPHVARSLLKEVATALATIPDGLQSSFADGADETAELQPDDFTSISSGTLNPLVTHCPFDATPPSADESPPPEETPPSMNPSPTPSMNPSPTPAMNPSPTPAPTATPGPTSSPVPTPGLTPPH